MTELIFGQHTERPGIRKQIDKRLEHGSLTEPSGKTTVWIEEPWLSDRVKLGRWTHCKYCYKEVLPALGTQSPWQVICSECGAGMSPYFSTPERLQRYWGGDDTAYDEELEQERAKRLKMVKGVPR